MNELRWMDCGDAMIGNQRLGQRFMAIAHDGKTLNAIVNRENTGNKIRWHVSISTASRYPTWDEIHSARYEFVPDDVCMAMILPAKSDYVNVCKTCFHLWEVDPE